MKRTNEFKVVAVKAMYDRQKDSNWNKTVYVLYSDNTWERIDIQAPCDFVTRELRIQNFVQKAMTKEEIHDIVKAIEQRINI